MGLQEIEWWILPPAAPEACIDIGFARLACVPESGVTRYQPVPREARIRTDPWRFSRRPLPASIAHVGGQSRRRVKSKHRARREPQRSQGRILRDPCGSLRALCLNTLLPAAPATAEDAHIAAERYIRMRAALIEVDGSEDRRRT